MDWRNRPRMGGPISRRFMGYIDDKTANNVAYDNSLTGLGTGDLQSALDALTTSTALGPAGLSISNSTSTSTTSLTFTPLNAMTISPTKSGNYSVFFTGQFNGVGDFQVAIYNNGVQVASSIRQAAGPTGTHNFIMSTSDKIAWTTGPISIQVLSVTGNTLTITGRNMTAIKVA